MVIIIKIDTSKIKNWDEIKEKHWRYVEEKVLVELKKSSKYNKYIIQLITGSKKSTKDNLAINLSKLISEKRDEWIKINTRYEKWMKLLKSKVNKKFNANIYPIVERFYNSSSKADSMIKNLKKTFEETESNTVFYTKLNSAIRKIVSKKDKIISDTDKIKVLEDIQLKEYIEYIKFQKKIKKIFNYTAFSKNESGWNRHKFLTMLGIEVCPYCNRQYITSYEEDDKKKKTTADLDHYYPQSEYPFLALSLYNFIPSCPICNRNFKKDNDKEIMYPYEESFDDDDVQYKFNTSIKDDVRYLIGEDKDFTLSINKRKDKYITNKLERANNSNEIFKLDKVYQSHKGYVEELFEKAYKYNEIWRSDINGIFKSEDSLFIDKKELFEFAFGKNLTPEEYSKRPLAKLTRDILDELGIEVK